jgi:hypothetical protein
MLTKARDGDLLLREQNLINPLDVKSELPVTKASSGKRKKKGTNLHSKVKLGLFHAKFVLLLDA